MFASATSHSELSVRLPRLVICCARWCTLKTLQKDRAVDDTTSLQSVIANREVSAEGAFSTVNTGGVCPEPL